MNTRRSFLLTSTAAIAGTYFHSGLAQTATAPDAFTNSTLGAYQQGILSQQQFERRVGSLFMVLPEKSDALYTRLRSVTPFLPKSASQGSGRIVALRKQVPAITRRVETFTLLFDSDKPLPVQDSYIVDHATLGRFVMFLVPGTSATGSPICTSVFTNFTEA